MCLTHWDWVTHICVSNLTIIASDNGLSPGRRQVIIWTNAGILLIGPLGTNFSEISIKIDTFSVMKTHLKMSPGRWQTFCLGLSVLIQYQFLNSSWPEIVFSVLREMEVSVMHRCITREMWAVFHDTVECHYNPVQYNRVLHTVLQLLRQNINPNFYS